MAALVKTAIIGASGFIGNHLLRAYREVYPDCLGTTFSQPRPDLAPFDLRNPDIATLRLEETGHEAVILASAKPNISYCEEQRDEAYAVNVRGTLELARQLSKTSLQLIFLSSDYVFEGTAGGYDDASSTCPTTEYGRQKVEVETALPGLVKNHLILRLAKSFGLKKGDGTLLDDIAASLAAGKILQAADDQFLCPTLIGDLVGAIQAIQSKGLTGTMNVCNPEPWSRYGLATELANGIGVQSNLVRKISLHEIPSMVGRPLDTSMACLRLKNEVSFEFTPTQEAIEQVSKAWRVS